MILYFSGTGNSKHVAERLAELLDEQLFNIETSKHLPNMVEDAPLAPEASAKVPPAPEASAEKPLGIIFPVYAWGLPKIVEEYFANKRLTNRFVWSVMTCGDDMGYADVFLGKQLKRPSKAVKIRKSKLKG